MHDTQDNRCIAGVKNLLAGSQQAAVTVAVEGLMDAKASADPDAFITFDPKVCLPCMRPGLCCSGRFVSPHRNDQ